MPCTFSSPIVESYLESLLGIYGCVLLSLPSQLVPCRCLGPSRIRNIVTNGSCGQSLEESGIEADWSLEGYSIHVKLLTFTCNVRRSNNIRRKAMRGIIEVCALNCTKVLLGCVVLFRACTHHRGK